MHLRRADLTEADGLILICQRRGQSVFLLPVYALTTSETSQSQASVLLQIDSFTSWNHLANKAALIKLVPAVASTAALLLTLKHSRNPFVLPAVLVAIPVSFHLVLLATGTTLQQAADAGWLMQPEVGRPLCLRHPTQKCLMNFGNKYL